MMAINFRGVFRTRSNIYGGAFVSKIAKSLNYFPKKTPSQIFDMALNTRLNLYIAMTDIAINIQL